MPTGIKGLDELLEGGFPEGRCIVVCGGPGTGKTIFSLQFLYYGAVNYGDKGLYVTLDESYEHLKEEASSFNWDLELLRKKGDLIIIDLSPVRSPSSELRAGLQPIASPDFKVYGLIRTIKNIVEEHNIKRIAVDPITALVLQYRDEYERRLEILQLIEGLSETGCTSIITSELRSSALERNFQIEEYAAHGVIILQDIERGGVSINTLKVEKMRGTHHDRELRPYKIQKNGIVVFPKEKVF